METKFKRIIEETDLEEVNRKIALTQSWELIKVAVKKIPIDGEGFSEQPLYILGEKYQDEDFLAQ